MSAQPSEQTSLNQSSNPTSKTTTESQTSEQPTSSTKTDTRVPSTHSSAPEPSSLGSGDTGPLEENAIPRSDAQSYSSNPDVEGEQMRAPGEGEVADAVREGGGGGHAEEKELLGDLDRKGREHDEELKRRGERTAEEIEEEEKEDWTGKRADVGEALGGRTGVVLAPEE